MEYSIKVLLGTNGHLQEGVVKAGLQNLRGSQEQQQMLGGLSCRRIFELVLLSNLQSGMESLSSLKLCLVEMQQ